MKVDKSKWEYVPIKRCCGQKSNIKWESNDSQSYNYIDLTSVDRTSHKIIEVSEINSKTAPSRAKQIVNTGDVIFATTRPLQLRCCIVPPQYDNDICSTGFCVVKPQIGVTSKWLFYSLISNRFANYISPLQKGATYPAISDKDVLNYCISIPHIDEQNLITSELDAVQLMIDGYKEQLSDLDALAKSIYLRSFDNIITNKFGFDIKKLPDVFDVITDGTHQTPTYTDDKIRGVKFLSAKDVVSGYINWQNIKYIPYELHLELQKRVKPQRNDILLCKNGTTGICALVDVDEIFDIYVSLALLRPKIEYCPVYLVYAINNPFTKEQFDGSLKGIGVPNLHLTEIKKTKIIIPPLSLQQQFAAQVKAIEKQKELLRQQIADAETLMAERMQYYFS